MTADTVGPALLAQIPDAAVCGIYVYSMVDGRNEYINPAYTRMTGWTLADIQAMSADAFMDLFHPDDRAAVQDHMGAVIAAPVGTAFDITYRFKHKDGHWVWCLSRDTLFEQTASGAPSRFLGTFIDVTASKVNEERLALATSMGGIGIWDWDLLTNTAVNDQDSHRMFGIEPGAGDDAQVWFDAIHPEDRERVSLALRAAIDTGVAYDCRFRVCRPDGTIGHVNGRGHAVRDADGQPIRFLGINIDITRQVEADAALRESERRLSLAMELAGVGIWTWDRTGAADNDARMHELFDIDDGDGASAATWFERIHPDDIARVSAAFEAALAGTAPYEIDYRVCHRDGSVHHVSTKGLVSRDADGQAERMFGVMIDQTAQVALQEQVGHKNKMEAIGQLAGGVAHDFNNQLTAILGNAELIGNRLTDERLRVCAEAIVAAARRSADLTRQLLNFARKGSMTSTPVKVDDLIREVVNILEHTIDKRVAINLQLGTHASWVRGDASQLQNALLNIAINARDAMREGGRMCFSAEELMIGAGVDEGPVHGLAPGRYVRLSVSDTGIGIPPSLLARVREPFFTTKEVGAGTGLGLSAADGIAEQHGGGLTITSEPGRGTEVSLYLPRYEQSAAVPAAPAPDASGRSASIGGRLLIIDDEPLVTALLENILSDAGHQVHCERDPRDGLRYFEAHHQDIDLVILDIIMPHLDGSGVFQRLRSLDPKVAVLLISGHSAFGVVERLLESGVRNFLQKPFSEREVCRAVENILEDVRLVHEPTGD